LDGHIVLSRELATENHYPAIDVLESVSRLNRDLTSSKQQELAGQARNLLSLLKKNQDLINIGAYVSGSNPEIDRALALQKPLREFLGQGIGQGCPATKSWELLQNALKSKQK
jgi:flagellum-specific ATP synthase